MKFKKHIIDEFKGWNEYIGENGYVIRKTHSLNMWTGTEMSDQVWEIFKDGKKIAFDLTLREAKERVTRLEEKVTK